MDEFLEKVEEREKEHLQEQLETVEGILEERDSVHQSLIGELDEEIESQSDLLSSSAKSDKPRIRDRLKELYRERREERRGNWRDRESLRERKLDLEDELASLGGLDDLDF